MPLPEGEHFRTCPWCGLNDAQMHVPVPLFQAPRKGQSTLWWAVITCPRCGRPIVIETVQNGGFAGEVIPGKTETELEHLPDDVKRYYDDAVKVLSAGVPDAAAVQLRKTLEAAAAHHGITEGPLVGRIQKLMDAGLITNQFGDVLHHIRKVGNVGAHASDDTVDEAGARTALRFTTQVLVNLFEIPAQLEALKAEADTAADDAQV